MSNRTLGKDADRGKRLSTHNSVDTKSVGVTRSTRSRAPIVRKCSACQPDDSCKTYLKIPQKSSGHVNKVSKNEVSNGKGVRIPETETDLKTLPTKNASSQVEQNSCEDESEAIASVKGTKVAKKKSLGEQKQKQKQKQVSQQTACIRKSDKYPKQTESKAATLTNSQKKESESKAFDRHKVSTKDSESERFASSSKPTSKKNSSPTTSKLIKKPAVPALSNQTAKNEPKGEYSIKQEVPRKKAETEVSEVESELSHSDSDSSSDSSDYEDYITWDGFEEDYTVGENCCLCDKDLSVSPLEDDDEYESEFSQLPVASVLPCGHVYHFHCLELAEFEEDYLNCVFCLSITCS